MLIAEKSRLNEECPDTLRHLGDYEKMIELTMFSVLYKKYYIIQK